MTATGERLAAARKKAGLTQRALAKRIRVSKALISMLEGDRRAPSVDVLMRLASALSVTPNDLLPEVSPESRAAHPDASAS